MGDLAMTFDRLAAIKYRLRMGYPAQAKTVRFHQAKADVATLILEYENLQRFVGAALAPKNDNGLKSAHGGKDEGDNREAAGDAGTGHRGANQG